MAANADRTATTNCDDSESTAIEFHFACNAPQFTLNEHFEEVVVEEVDAYFQSDRLGLDAE
jgi:hypothetical protein